MSRPSLERRRSIEEQRPYVDHRGSHARHRTQGLSPSHHQHHHDTPRDGRHSHMHVATATSTAPTVPSPIRHCLRVLGTPRPPLDPIKKRTVGSLEDKRTKRDIFSTSDINISSNTLFYSFLETWDWLSLSQLVTPTQALRCKEIQYSFPPLDVGPSLPEPG
jgi:hypothetical protein